MQSRVYQLSLSGPTAFVCLPVAGRQENHCPKSLWAHRSSVACPSPRAVLAQKIKGSQLKAPHWL